jgi:uncharacterized membrane protein
MNRMLVVIFDNERAAELGTRAMKDLNAEGDITVYAMGVIAKDAAGKISIKQASDQWPIGTGVGLAVGSVIGMLGGPVGVAVGAVAGTLAGALRDFWAAGVGIDFIEEAENFLRPGKIALIAEIEEEWIVPVDSRMEAIGGVVFRRARADIEQAQFDHDVAVVKAEIVELETEYKRASGDAKTKLQAKIVAAKSNLDQTLQRAKLRVSELEAASSAKIKLVETQISVATGEMKANLESRLNKVRSASHERSSKLKQAWGLTKEALSA